MSSDTGPGPVTAADVAQPVTAADVAQSVALASAALRSAAGADWQAPAGSLDWTCWETVEHVADDLFAYAVQLGPAALPQDTYVPIVCDPRRPGGPASSIFAKAEGGPDGLLQVLEACGALLTAMVATAPPHARSFHVFGLADPAGFAAMGVVEVLVHTHDVAAGVGVDWEPPAGLCARVLHRLFPDAPTGHGPWPTLLWATGRGELSGHPALTRWRWYADPR